eukprot:6188468-Prorocentrum_lima.AAC.1
MRQRARRATAAKKSWLMIVLDVSAAFDEVRRDKIDEEIDKEQEVTEPGKAWLKTWNRKNWITLQ